jgi:hypothetical protein
MRASDKAVRRPPRAVRRFARIAFVVVATALLVPLFSIAAITRALYQRIVRGKASKILRARQGPYRSGVFYGTQMAFAKPFDASRFRDVFFEMVEEAGIDRTKVRMDFESEVPRPFPPSGAVEADHYVDPGRNWLKRGRAFKGSVLWLHVFNGNNGEPTVIQAGLPGGSWDGSSCFNFMKELVARYYGEPRCDVFQGKKLILRPESARLLDQDSFVVFLLRLPRDVALNTWSLVWNLAAASRALGGPGAGPEIALINFDETDSARLQSGAESRGVKTYAALAFAAINAYRTVLGKNPRCLIQQASLQTRHYEPKLERSAVGDWLIGPLQHVPGERYTLEDAQRGYERLVRDLDVMGDDVRRAFDAKAYGLLNGGAAVFELPPTYGLDAQIWDSIFFNNYGVRSVCRQADFVSWNWSAPFKLGFNAIYANGRTCITLTSYVLGLETLRAVRDHAAATLHELMTSAPVAIGTSS